MTKTPLLALLPLLVCSGCGGNGDSSPEPPPVPPSLSLSGFVADGSEVAANAECVEIGSDAEQTLLVVLDGTSATAIGDWILRPPGSCGSTAACGHLVARVDPQGTNTYALQATSATVALSLPFSRPCPQTAPEAECVGIDDPSGDHTIEITLRDDNGLAVLDDDLDPARLTFSVTLALPGGC